MKLQRYVIKTYYETKTGVDVELLFVHAVSKDDIINKLSTNMSMSNEFTLFDFDWNVNDIKKYGYDIFTVAEAWKEV